MLPDIEIARQTALRPIDDVAAQLGIGSEHLEHYGRVKAKISQEFCQQLENEPTAGKLVLVSAINPTPAGEGKTTTTIGLGDALNRLGKRTTVCLREPSLGPCFGMKGGGAGGGYAQVAPMEDINLHFTGDIHAVSAAHNLLAAALDNYIHHGNVRRIDHRRIVWNRVLDINDRALRDIVIGLGGTANSFPRQSGFDIAVASEVMAILCLSESRAELKERLGRIVVAQTRARETVRATDLAVHGAMAVLLKDACQPNLVQTLEGNPALVHGGPFANIAHGCNSIAATRLSTRLSEYTITEAGFGADLGAEKIRQHQVPPERPSTRPRSVGGHGARPQISTAEPRSKASPNPMSERLNEASKTSRSTSKTSASLAYPSSSRSMPLPRTPTPKSSASATSALTSALRSSPRITTPSAAQEPKTSPAPWCR